ncbi:MAG TPA: hypothetical protein PK252_12470 [Bacteroidales bacterium]|nr:hypothetical protein [Bacteroidales bacterium]
MKTLMIKLMFLTVCTCLCSTAIYSQTLKDKSISEVYYLYPNNPLPSFVSTFYIETSRLGKDEECFNTVNDPKYAWTRPIEGYTQVYNESEADIKISFERLNYKIVRKEAIDTVIERSEKKDYERFYRVFFTIRFELVVKGKKMPGVIFKEPININSFFETRSIAAKESLEKQISQTEIDNTLKNYISTRIFSLLRNYWGKEQKALFRMDLYTAKGKHNYDDLDDAFKQFKTVMKEDIKGGLNEEQKKKIESCVAVWGKALTEKDTVNPKARITKEIYCGLCVNLAVANAWLGNIENAESYYYQSLGYNNDKDFKNNLKQVRKWLLDYESRYIKNHPEYKIMPLLEGKWRLIKYISDEKVDLNKDGKESNDILSELDSYKKHKIFDISANRILNVIEGDAPACEAKTTKYYYKVSKNKINERKYLIFDDNEDIDESLASIFQITSLNGENLTIKGMAYLTGDTTSEVEFTFSKTK